MMGEWISRYDNRGTLYSALVGALKREFRFPQEAMGRLRIFKSIEGKVADHEKIQVARLHRKSEPALA